MKIVNYVFCILFVLFQGICLYVLEEILKFHYNLDFTKAYNLIFFQIGVILIGFIIDIFYLRYQALKINRKEQSNK